MEFDALVLARFQFAFTIASHIIFPAFTIGAASYLMVLEGLWLWRKDQIYLTLYKYWIKIFALAFGMGVVSGVVMSYQFGTNWGPFADMTGPILGPLIGYEVLSAFFLEAGFLGVMLYGMDRVGKKLHFFATCMVAAGTLFSAFWILSANSWMHTPAGFVMSGTQFVPDDWLAILFNPSFPFRLVHMVLAAYITSAFVIGGVGAYHVLKNKKNQAARKMFSMAMWTVVILVPLQMIAGDFQGRNTLEWQPVKIAAIEGNWETGRGVPLILFAIPDMEQEKNLYEVSIPKLGSLILTHEWDGEVPGMKSWPAEDRPNSTVIFWTFRAMVGIGVLMLLTGLTFLYLRIRGKMFEVRPALKVAVVMAPSGFLAVLAGWVTTEMGRQPYVVYGLLRTEDGVSPIDALAVGASLTAFVVVYFLVFGAGIYYLLRMMRHPPGAPEKIS